MAIHLSTRQLALAGGLAGIAYLIGWGRGSCWTSDVMSDSSKRAPSGAPHWS